MRIWSLISSCCSVNSWYIGFALLILREYSNPTFFFTVIRSNQNIKEKTNDLFVFYFFLFIPCWKLFRFSKIFLKQVPSKISKNERSVHNF
ncbi:hypothetical protein E4413_05070 [Leptospira interrogans]|uniref:Uncharacterized protein n=2 Tax=Leptospira interrogans TaxID=173 RepID=A0AAP9WD79_LEPIR|nr:hypothetical protein A6J42_21235 [Leptospira interrogans serovar Copenhageni]MBE0304320.1 hypothetical protein [Leptospira interrogans serovar Yeoncheon]QCO32395.1 hypothetical protein E4414_04375 [Leptospira interrogans]QEI00795.1 hypothetical protein FWJ33_16175 [Leptospira interrogans serovar Hardjo]QOI33739.1 hypothetical protein LeptoLang_05595 [Leptospira interrogans serovar Icterohaemorrhagiae]QOI39324.1 hypothetical protein Lepto1548_14280 [Leptospira interrogans serovar Bataviae]Q